MLRTALSIIALAFVSVSLSVSVAGASAQVFDINADPVVRRPALFQRIYVPSGFDSNDHVQIVGEGMFRSTCYRPAPTSVRVVESARTIYIGPVAYEYAGLCLQVVLPFERTIEVGILKPGLWKVVQESNSANLGEIKINEATVASADDFLYAPISQAFFRQRGMRGEVLLTGYFLNNCMSLEDVKVSVEKRVIVLQPLVRIEERSSCENGRFPFFTTVPIDLIPKGRYLLHVRTMNGNAINSLVEVR